MIALSGAIDSALRVSVPCRAARKEGRKEGLLPVRGLSVLKTDSHGRCIPCHAVVGEDLVRRVAAPAAKTKFY